jgi:hypothetical protein
MGEGEPGRVKEVSVEREGVFFLADDVRGSVEGVADYRMAHGLEMDANLMCAACLDADLDEGEEAVGRGETFENLDVGDGGTDSFAVGGATGGHAVAADEIAAYGEVDGGVVFGDVTVDEGNVGLFDLALGEHVAELAVGAVVFGDEDDTAGLLVEAVDDAGAEVSADAGELVEVVEESVDEGAVVAGVVGDAGAGVDHHACGLVDDGEVLVFVEDLEGDVLGEGVEGWRVRGTFDFDGLAAVELLFGLGGRAGDADLAVLDEELDTGAADVGDGLGEVLVEAQACGFGCGSEGVDVVFGVIIEVDLEDGDGRRGRLFDASGGAVLVFDGATALALGEHVLRRHG